MVELPNKPTNKEMLIFLISEKAKTEENENELRKLVRFCTLSNDIEIKDAFIRGLSMAENGYNSKKFAKVMEFISEASLELELPEEFIKKCEEEFQAAEEALKPITDEIEKFNENTAPEAMEEWWKGTMKKIKNNHGLSEFVRIEENTREIRDMWEKYREIMKNRRNVVTTSDGTAGFGGQLV